MRCKCVYVGMYVHTPEIATFGISRISIGAISLATSRVYSRSFTASSKKPSDKTKYIIGIFNPKLDLIHTRVLLSLLKNFDHFSLESSGVAQLIYVCQDVII